MRYTSHFPQPTVAERALIKRTAKAIVKKFDTYRAAGERIGVTPNYLYALCKSKRANPGNTTLRKLGLRRVSYIEER